MKNILLILIVIECNMHINAQTDWTPKSSFGGNTREGATGFAIGTKVYIGTGSDGSGVLQNDLWEWDQVNDVWTQKASFGTSGRHGAVGFSIGTKGYIGTGNNGTIALNDLWAWNQTTNTWNSCTNLGGVARTYAVGFAIGSKGYIGTGYDNSTNTLNDFWEFNSSTNSWTQKANYGGHARGGAVGFIIGTKGYIGTGYSPGCENEFYEWDQTTNVWTQKSAFSGTERNFAVAFSNGTNGFIATGSAISDAHSLSDVWKWDQTNNTWVQLDDFDGSAREHAVGLAAGDYFYIGTGHDNYTGFSLSDFWEFKYISTWSQKADLPSDQRYRAVGFSISTKGYIGTGGIDTAGSPQDMYRKDFWEWDQATNAWTQKADFGGTRRHSAVGFSIGNKGYIGTGEDTTAKKKKDFWEWDQSTNTWTRKADFGGTCREGAVGFSIGTKGYIGTGWDSTGTYNKQDFWEWDQAADTWAQKANYGGSGRFLASAFSIGTKGYIGLGRQSITGSTNYVDFWGWDQSSDTWTQKADFAGVQRSLAVGLSIGSVGYICAGWKGVGNYYNDLWLYNPSTDEWLQKPDMEALPRSGAVGFSIGQKGYIGTGRNDTYVYLKDLWEFNDGPDVQAKDIVFSNVTDTTFNIAWTNGNGTGSVVFIKKDSTGMPSPPDFSTYTANNIFGAGSQIGTTGWYCIYKGTGSNVTALCLQPGANYRVMVCSYNGSLGIEKYNTFNSINNPLNQATSISYVYWTQLENFSGTSRAQAISFSIGDKGYVGTGRCGEAPGVTYYQDFWEYNSVLNSWSQKADFGGGNRAEAVGFSIGSAGYVGTGYGSSGFAQDFWEYNSLTNNWTQKADFSGGIRYGAVAFSIGSKGYLGTGKSNLGGVSFKDFWEYDPSFDIWTQKADFGGVKRIDAVGFSIGSKGYIGTGRSITTPYPQYEDFWEYDPDSNIWTQKADFAGGNRTDAVGFSIGSRGFIGTGASGNYSTVTKYNDFWKFDPVANIWIQISNCNGSARYSAIGFSIGSSGFVGTGAAGNSLEDYSTCYSDFWGYNYSSIITNELEVKDTSAVEIFPNPAIDRIEIIAPQNSQIEILNIEGRILKRTSASKAHKIIDISEFQKGMYFVKVTNEKGIVVKKFVKE